MLWGQKIFLIFGATGKEILIFVAQAQILIFSLGTEKLMSGAPETEILIFAALGTENEA